MSTQGKIYQALHAVMGDVGAVRKGERNQAQNFNFRGIDAVTNAVSPALRKHGVIVVPTVNRVDYATVEVGKDRKLQASVRVDVTYTFYCAEDGSYVEASVAAESMDSGDKATAKAMSVAFRIALIQTLCLPTDEPDPDHDTYERSPSVSRPVPKPAPQKPLASDESAPMTTEQMSQFVTQCGKVGIDPSKVAENAGVDLDAPLTQGDVAKLRVAYNELKAFREGN